MSFETLNKKGSIVVITLVIMLVMTTMGLGFYYSTLKTVNSSRVDQRAAEGLYSAESCITEAIALLKNHSKNGPPPLCLNKPSNKPCGKLSGVMSDWSPNTESVKNKKKMNLKTYSCEIYPLGMQSISSSSGSGFDVGNSSAYNSTNSQTKYFYKIKSYSEFAAVEAVISGIF